MGDSPALPTDQAWTTTESASAIKWILWWNSATCENCIAKKSIVKTGPIELLCSLVCCSSSLVAFGVFLASALSLGLLGVLLRSPEGYEDETGFHLRIRVGNGRTRTRRGRRWLTHLSAGWVPPSAQGGRVRMVASHKSFWFSTCSVDLIFDTLSI